MKQGVGLHTVYNIGLLLLLVTLLTLYSAKVIVALHQII